MDIRPDMTETETELLTELAQLHRRLVQLEALEIEHEQTLEDQAKLIAELDAFAHTVAHDLQAPLSAIVGFADFLLDEHRTMPAEQLENSLQTIGWVGRKMSKIIDELLLLSAVRGQEEVPISPLDMAAILIEAERSLAYLVRQYQAEIFRPADWPAALGYAPWIEEVWVNYLSNGLKYGGHPPHLELGAEEQPDGMIRFWVQDNGRGLTPRQRTQLFIPFAQLSQVRTKGHGLGLSIVYRIIRRLGGEVGVESEGIPGRGSQFYFTLPAASTGPAISR